MGARPGRPVAAPAARIAYLCAQYPAVSHTFIMREVEALRELGAQIETFSIRRAGSEHLLTDADRRAFQSTFAILPPSPRKLLGAHLRLALGKPLTYASTLLSAVSSAAGPRARLWQFFYFLEAVVLWNECRKRSIRHVHVHLANVAADVALLVARIGSRTEPQSPWSWSFTMHGPTEFFDVGHFRLARKVKDARFVVCISDYARSQLMYLSDPQKWDSLKVVHCGIPLERFTRSTPRARLDAEQSLLQPTTEQPRILCLGRLVPEKGQTVLLDALAELNRRGRSVHATFAGEGPSREGLEASVRELGLDAQVDFLGAVGQDDIRRLYEDASIFCLPSFAEGVPCVLMEAMAMRLPTLSTRIAGIPELIEDGRNGLLVAPGRADQLADAIERLMLDPELCEELGANARITVEREFDVERSARELCEIFAEQLSPSVAGPASGSSTIRVLGVTVHRLSGEQALQKIGGWERGQARMVAYVNAHTLNQSVGDAPLRGALDRADLVLNDGFGLSLAARMRGESFPENLNGSDFTRRLLDLAAQRGWRTFLLGAEPGIAATAAAKLRDAVEGLQIVGALDGFTGESEQQLARHVRDSGADLLVLALGNPLQELWLARNLEQTGVHVGVGVGAFLDFTAGKVRRAPRWMNVLGIEWCFRLVQEPRRLWRRYVVGNPIFLLRAWRDRSAGVGR
jgi:exopolysaccharide biosynthesis WecB/TagA/CpsF family protein